MDCWLKTGSWGQNRKSENEYSDRKKSKPTEEKKFINSGDVSTSRIYKMMVKWKRENADPRFGLKLNGLNLRGSIFGLILVKMVNLSVVFDSSVQRR